MPVPIALKYRAFLSYAHADAKWASWLHRSLERYPIGKDLIGRDTQRGPVPANLRPIFRDRDDFTGGLSLDAATIAALDQSATLVVLCSTAAAKRSAVNEEIRLFRWRHPARPVIPVFVGGTYPDNVPPALLFAVDHDGALTDRAVNILGPDLRDKADGRTVGLAKVVAGITGLATDEIVRRAERDRLRRQRNWSAGLLAVMLALSGLTVWAELNKREADTQRGQAEQNRQIAEKERDQAFVTQSRFLADVANRTTQNDDPISAALVAIEGLPSEEAGRKRPYVTDAELALYKAFTAAREHRLFAGHADAVFRAAFSPDQTKVATASADGTARVFDLGSGNSIALLEGHANRVVDVTFVPNGSKILTASLDGTAKLWDTATGKKIWTLQGHTFDVKRVRVNSTGDRAVTASTDNTARVWDLANGRTVHILKGHLGIVWDAQFSPDDTLVATASLDHSVRLWNSATGNLVTALGGHTSQVNAVQFSGDGKFILTRSQDKTARVYRVDGGDLVCDLIGHDAMLQTARFSQDGKLVVTGDDTGDVRLWSIPEGRQIARLSGHQGRVHDAKFNASGSLLATAGADGTTRLWDVPNARRIQTFAGHIADVYSVMFLRDDHILTTGKDATVRVWSLRPENVSHLTGHSGPLKTATFSRDGRRIATSSDDRTARVWDVATGTLILATPKHKSSVHAAIFSTDSSRLFTGDAGRIRVWNVDKAVEADGWEAFTGSPGVAPDISRLAIDPDGKRIAAVSNISVAIFDIATKSVLSSFKTGEFIPLSLSFSHDGQHLLTSGFGPTVDDDGSVNQAMSSSAKLWNVETPQVPVVLERQLGMTFATFAAQNAEVWTSSQDGWLRRRNAATGDVLGATLVPDAQEINESPVSRLLALSRFRAPTTFRRKLDTGDIASTAMANSDIWRLEFASDGKRFATAHSDGVARIWPAFASHDELIATTLSAIPRCLTPSQRRDAFLPETPPTYCFEQRLWPYDSADWSEWRRRVLAGGKPAMPDRRGRLGIVGATLTDTSASAQEGTFVPGVLVSDLIDKGAADRAGIKAGDIIVNVGQESISTMEQLTAAVSWIGVGRSVAIDVIRGNKRRTLEATLDPFVPIQTFKPDADAMKVSAMEKGEHGKMTREEFAQRMMREDGSAIYWSKERHMKEAEEVDESIEAARSAATDGDYLRSMRELDRAISRMAFLGDALATSQPREFRAAQATLHGRFFGDLTWYAVLARQPVRALMEATKAIQRHPDGASIKLNRAHALLANDRVAEARAIYLAGIGTKMDDDAQWEDTVIDDLVLLGKLGVHAGIDGIIAEMRERKR